MTRLASPLQNVGLNEQTLDSRVQLERGLEVLNHAEEYLKSQLEDTAALLDFSFSVELALLKRGGPLACKRIENLASGYNSLLASIQNVEKLEKEIEKARDALGKRHYKTPKTYGTKDNLFG